MTNACILTGTPRLSRGLMASLLAHSIWLPLVLGHASVDGSAAISANTLQFHVAFSYWTMSGRIGALNTSGRGCVELLAEPSADRMETVGRLVILAVC